MSTAYKVPTLNNYEWQQAVIDKTHTAPPAASKGDRYIVATGGTGAWNLQDNKIAEYNGSTWDFIIPTAGMMTWIITENLYYRYKTSWEILNSEYLLKQPTADVVVNSSNGDFDWQFKGVGDSNLLFLDAGNSTVGIGTVGYSDAKLFVSNYDGTSYGKQTAFLAKISTNVTDDIALDYYTLDTGILNFSVASGKTLTGGLTSYRTNVLLGQYFAGSMSYTRAMHADIGINSLLSTGNINEVIGQSVHFSHVGLGTIANAYGFQYVIATDTGITTNSYGSKIESLQHISANGQTRYGYYVDEMPDPGAYTGTDIYAIKLVGNSRTSRDGIQIGGDTNLYSGDANLLKTDDTFQADAGIYLGGSNQELRFYEGVNYVGFSAPALSANKIWVLPSADGSIGQVLKTDGSGNLNFADDGTGSVIVSLADDATVSLATGVAGWLTVMFGDNEEKGRVWIASDGSVEIENGSLNFVNTDMDTKACVYDGGTGAVIKNRLGATKKVLYQFISMTP